MIDQEAEVVINQAVRDAARLGHEYVTIEHLLLAMISNEKMKRTIEDCGGCAEEMQQSLKKFLAQYLTKNFLAPDQLPKMTVAFRRVIQRAAVQIQRSGNKILHGEAILVAMLSETSSFAVHALHKQNIKKNHIVSYLSHQDRQQGRRQGEEEHKQTGSSSLVFGIDMCKQVVDGDFEPLIGREEELQQLVRILSYRKKANPMLVGEAGVGKTSLVQGLASIIVKDKAPACLRNASLTSLDISAIVAGARYRGDFEERFSLILQGIEKKTQPILFIDDVQAIVSTGINGALDASHILKSMLSSSKVKVIATTNFTAYRNHVENNPALSRRFHKLEIKEPSEEQTQEILLSIKEKYERFHGVRYHAPVLKLLVEMSARHLRTKNFPDKAIDVMDAVGAEVACSSPQAKRPKVIKLAHICSTISRMAKIPEERVTHQRRKQLLALEGNLKKLIFGQDEAITEVCETVLLSQSGLEQREKPIGSFMFSGSTGVGKTELAKQLSACLGIDFIRFDMSEYVEKHTISRLLGSPPGYVGYSQGGMLTDAVINTPHAVLLLDEIEKAHPSLLNILLQVMDYGFLTDASGRKANFQHIILIMTTNVYVGDEEEAIGFKRTEAADTGAKSHEAINEFFTAEFRNRLDGVIFFRPLEKSIMIKIVDKFLQELAIQLAKKDIKLKVSAAAKEQLCKLGYCQQQGARPLFRVVQNHLKKPLAKDILRKKNAATKELHIGISEGEFYFKFA